MALILADVGGTNVRFACARGGVIDAALTRRFQNDDCASFDAALAAYLGQVKVRQIEALTVAVAGPGNGVSARLTNRDWQFDTRDLARSLDIDRVNLMNDLGALGYALDLLDEDGVRVLLPAEPSLAAQMQRLVVGIGTGFNVSPVLSHSGGVTCLLAEAGLGSLPSRMRTPLEAYLDKPAPWVRCVEDVISGPGLSRLHHEATGVRLDARVVLERAALGDAAAMASREVFAHMLGEWVQDLRLLYMPTGGIFLAGSVVRALLDSPARDIFVQTVSAQPTVKSTLPPVAISVITQDEAALLGCLAFSLSA
ncbi:Glucokinase [Roseobacter fucihabitans]|uniref:Glucokinase n=1 Tax=Roseobacter fucihabitans TaxID=1537242 RepID=A0ABZ2BTX3_9RHOB|nr:glucokinase [Roseobacter litoralis]MBC6964389.1 Glucokinase [Roseobacter litoralis]